MNDHQSHRPLPSGPKLTDRGLPIRLLFFAIAYLLAVAIGHGLALSREPVALGVLWPVAGLFLGAAILVPTRQLFAYSLVAVAIHLSFGIIFAGRSLGASLGGSVAILAQTLLAVWILRRWFGTAAALATIRQMFSLFVASIAGASLGATIQTLFAQLGTAPFALDIVWPNAFLSNVLGIMVVLPPLVLASDRNHRWMWTMSSRRVLEYGSILAGLAVAVMYGFDRWGSIPIVRPCFAIPFLLWSALRFDLFRSFFAYSFFALLSTYAAGDHWVAEAAWAESAYVWVGSLQAFLWICGVSLYVVAGITKERMDAVRSLQESREWLSQALKASDMAVWSWDARTDRFDFSEPVEHYFGNQMSKESFTVQRFLQSIHPDDRPQVEEKIGAARNGDGYEADYRVVWPDGSVHWLASRGKAYRDQSGQTRRMAGVITRIDDRKQAEERLRESEQQLLNVQKMDAVGQLAGGIAHDFNNLLTVINGYSELLLHELPPDGPAIAMVNDIHNAGERAAALTKQLLVFSRKQALRPSATDLNEVLVDLDLMLRSLVGEDIRLEMDLGADLRPIHADAIQLEQVIINLVVNARDAMPGGGDLTIRTAVATYSGEEAAGRTSEPYACLSVTDSGTGIDAAIRTRIFEPFFTTKSIGKGSGLGLAMVYGFVKQSGGFIDVETESMRGSTFRLYLPFAAGSGVTATVPDALSDGRGRGERILLVEDDVEVSRVTEQSLLRQGYQVRVFNDPQQAIDYAANPEVTIDLLLTDVVMPHLNGHEMAQRILRARPGIKVLYISGHTRDVKIAGICDNQFLEKPFTPESLARRVRLLLDATPSTEHDR